MQLTNLIFRLGRIAGSDLISVVLMQRPWFCLFSIYALLLGYYGEFLFFGHRSPPRLRSAASGVGTGEGVVVRVH